MKSSIKAFAIIALLAVVAVGCNKVEKILPKKDGLWQGVNSTVLSYLNDSLMTTTIDDDSLGTMYFDKDGSGYSQDFNNSQQHPFTWVVADGNDQITITDTSGTSLTWEILESSSKEQKWHAELLDTIITGYVLRTDITTTMDRVK